MLGRGKGWSPTPAANTSLGRLRWRLCGLRERISYPEDSLRQDFFGDHPWELARPRVVLEDGGDDSGGYEWGRGLEQEGKRVDGER